MCAQDMERSWRCGPGPFRQVIDEIRRQGGTVAGSQGEGTLGLATPLGRLEGRYRFDGEELTVTIMNRPEQLSIGRIWEQLDRICGPPVGRA